MIGSALQGFREILGSKANSGFSGGGGKFVLPAESKIPLLDFENEVSISFPFLDTGV